MVPIVFGLIAKFNVCQRRSRVTRRRKNLRARGQRLLVLVGAIIGVGDSKRVVHAVPSK